MTGRPRWRTSIAAIWAVGYLACSGGAGPAASSKEGSGADSGSTSSVLPASEVDWQLRIDYAQHTGSALVRWLRLQELARTSTLPSLSAAEGAQLCDWANEVLGGYGRTVACPAGPRGTDRDQAYCLSGLPSCPDLTVADIEDCALAQGADVCKYFTANACATLRACALGE